MIRPAGSGNQTQIAVMTQAWGTVQHTDQTGVSCVITEQLHEDVTVPHAVWNRDLWLFAVTSPALRTVPSPP